MSEPSATDAARLTVLAQLEGMSIHRLARLLGPYEPTEAFHRVAGRGLSRSIAEPDLAEAWRKTLAEVDLAAVNHELVRLGLCVTSWHHPEHPREFVDDIDPAPVLFRLGVLPDPSLPKVAIVGTRRCSGPGREIAYELGGALSAAGVVVVSGLAKGVDGAAHEGTVALGGAPPVAVVGSGPDIVYPRHHRRLWEQVAELGCVVGEAPPGAPPEPWRFPARNRLIAALADLVVVVESRAAGGSLLTVEQAIRRGVDVMAVPGSLRNPAAEGTNQLLVDGCAPVRGADDVLMALGLSSVDRAAKRSGQRRMPSGDGAAVLDAVDDGPTAAEEIVLRSGLDVRVVYAQIEILIGLGHLVPDGGRVRRS